MNSSEIKRLKKEGMKQETAHFQIFCGKKNRGACAVIVSKANGKAVERNRLKRRIRSIHRQMKTTDALYIVKRGAGIPGYHEMTREIREKDK